MSIFIRISHPEHCRVLFYSIVLKHVFLEVFQVRISTFQNFGRGGGWGTKLGLIKVLAFCLLFF